ncbi:TetR/AcrR family transcriptional regulator [Pontivivens ytuae]|uniref:TetR/AcrR family transcriptional regulator n=1 Tax=Pontivivens ytuae TaxID=2789856 RepID=A0A7S9LQZ6_9RHOB|nr:TetR/AcrR family transcriptional regulator [Pontivivens ytuae]QPH53130.1 TetR/AcrR family transcriptional regulator [Pontivivens ytuae]
MARPRTFEPDAARDALMALYWEKGFEGASMQDVEAATGLKKQSLYRLFGDKRGMYLAALARYEETEIAAGETLLVEGSAQERFARLFAEAVDRAIEGDRRGCFLCNASLDQAQLDAETRAMVSRMVDRLRRIFAAALVEACPDPAKRAVKAAQLVTFYFGLRVMVRADAPEAVLRAVVAETVRGI